MGADAAELMSALWPGKGTPEAADWQEASLQVGPGAAQVAAGQSSWAG